MSVGVLIRDGTGSEQDAKVDQTGKRKERALWVNIAGVSPGVALPVGPGITGARFDQLLSLNGLGVTTNMSVNGSGTPQTFLLMPDPVDDIILTELVFFSTGGTIKLNNFFSRSSLSNGCELSLKADNNTLVFRRFYTTSDVDLWSTLGGFTMRAEAAGDNAKGILVFSPELPIRAQGTFGVGLDDYIKLVVNDNLTSIPNLVMMARGVKVPAGSL